MIDMQTEYLGLKLKHPLVPSSSPLSHSPDQAKALEDAGASALVMHSLFEEEILHEEAHFNRFLHQPSLGFAEADSFHPGAADYTSKLDTYLEQIQSLKQSLAIPIIASLNGITDRGWTLHAKDIQQAGADALELNIYHVASNINEDALQVEQRYLQIVTTIVENISIPVTVKLSPYFSSLPHFASQLEQIGAKGLSLFNRYYQPDIDLDNLGMNLQLEYSNRQESLLRVRWIGLLRKQTAMSLAATGGFHHYEDILKALLSGADVVHLCSTLLEHGVDQIGRLLAEMQVWIEKNEYTSIAQLKGSLCRECARDPAAYEHANYFHVLNSHTPARGVNKPS